MIESEVKGERRAERDARHEAGREGDGGLRVEKTQPSLYEKRGGKGTGHELEDVVCSVLFKENEQGWVELNSPLSCQNG